MNPERFEHLSSLVGPLIKKEDTKLRKSISPAERLIITLRYLERGDSQQSLSYAFRVGKSTVSGIIAETCDAIYQSLKSTYLSPPKTTDDWLKISTQFEELWNMPHALGSIDGKHIRIESPKLSGILYYIYKVFFSIVLLAICDANYCFTMFDLGQYGSNNDSGVLANSKMGGMFEENQLSIPNAQELPGSDVEILPYYLLRDEIFPLKTFTYLVNASVPRTFDRRISEDIQL